MGADAGEAGGSGCSTMTAVRPTVPGSSPPFALPEGFGPAPPPKRSRNLAGALLGALLVLLCGTGVAVYASNAGHRHAVLVVVRPVSAGATIRAGDLGESRISADPQIHSIAAAGRGRVIGRTAAVNLVPGTLLTLGELSNGPAVAPGSAVVGLALKPGRLPSGVKALDRVSLIETIGGTSSVGSGLSSGSSSGSASASGSVLASEATVSSVVPAPDGQSTVVSVVVGTDQAPTIAAAAARDEVTVVLLGGSHGP